MVVKVDVSIQSHLLKMINEDLSSKDLLLPENITHVFDDLGVITKGL
jgi:hypothetical protein